VNRKPRLVRLGAVIGVCALAGAAAGIAGSAAAPSNNAKKGNSSRHAGPPRGFHGPAVHADEVVLNKARNGFITETEDNGKVKSVAGDQLTITEGIGNVTYKDVTLKIPSNATIVRNFAKAALGDLKAGDFVHVSQSSDGTFVLASDASHRPGRGHFGPHGGPRDDARGPGRPGPPGPPPA
jgi:pectate lyase